MKMICDKKCPHYEICQLKLGGKDCYYPKYVHYEYTLTDKIMDAIIKIFEKKC